MSDDNIKNEYPNLVENTIIESKNALKREQRWDKHKNTRSEFRKQEKERKRRRKQEENQQIMDANGGILPPIENVDKFRINQEYPFKYIQRLPKEILTYIRKDAPFDVSLINDYHELKKEINLIKKLESEGKPLPETLPEFVEPFPVINSEAYNPINPGYQSQNPTLVIDCGHENQMIDKEIYSLIKQLAHCYGANSRARAPCKLVVTGLTSESKTLEGIKRYGGHEEWLWETFEEDYKTVFSNESIEDNSINQVENLKPQLNPKYNNIVYLTAESDNIIEKLDNETVYVIGGIVDHNRLKGYAQESATSHGVRTARLPIDMYMQNGARSVLTIVNVLELLLARRVLPWGEAFQSILPTRWKWVSKDEQVQLDKLSDEAIDGVRQIGETTEVFEEHETTN